MRVCVFGAGAIGGQIGAQLARSGVDVSLIARGPHLEAMQKKGLRLITADDDFTVHPTATQDPSDIGEQDYVFVSLKAHSVPGIVDAMQPLLGPNTAVVTAVNGIPWWYFYAAEGDYQNHQLDLVDPGGKQWHGIGPERAIGCVVWQAAEILDPGVVQLNYGSRMPIGEPDNSRSERALALSKALIAAGSKSPVKRNIRDEIWIKLWGNLSLNPMSLLTHATLEDMVGDDAVRRVIRDMMVEAATIAEKLGVRFAMDVDKRIESAGEVGAHKTSMLQDLELGRPIELDALTGVVAELGRLTDTPTPTIDMVYATARRRAREAGIYPEPK